MVNMILTFRILKTASIALSSISIQTWLIFRCREQMAIARKARGSTGRQMNSKPGMRLVVPTRHRQPGRKKRQLTTMHSSNGNSSSNIRQWRRGCQWQNSHKIRTLLSVTLVQCNKGIQSSTLQERNCQREPRLGQAWIRQDLLVLRNPSLTLDCRLSKNRQDEHASIILD